MSKLHSALLTLALVLATGPTALAQGITIGGHAGVSVATLDTEEDVDSRTGFVIGGFLGIDLGGFFNFQPEILYAQKGAEIGDQDFTGTIELNYIEFVAPAMLMIPVRGASVHPRVYAGPSVSIEAACNVSAEAGGFSAKLSCDELQGLGLEIDTKSIDFGLLFGAGIDVPAGPGAITVDARYDLGLTNINDTAGDNTDIKNRSWQFLAGYALHLGL